MKMIAAAVVTATVLALPCMAQEQIGGSPWLLDALRRITDEGALSDPARVGDLLHIRFEGEPARKLLAPIGSCRDQQGVSDDVLIEHHAEPEWMTLKTEDGGATAPSDRGSASSPVPARPLFHYTEVVVGSCSDSGLPGMRRAMLAIAGLPTFVCVQRPDLERLPGFEGVSMTHGARVFVYRRPINDQRAAELMFWFSWDKPCAWSVTIRQGPERGHRYQRAEARWRTCRDDAERRYCAAHGLVAWDDEPAQEAMEEAVVGVCGSMASAYDREPLAGPAPPARTNRDLVPDSMCPKP